MQIARPESNQPMPASAKEVFKGVLFSVYQWPQEQFDGSKATFEKLRRTDTVSVLPVMPNGGIMLTRQEQPGIKPFVSSIGGQVDPGESPLEAAKRELVEEAGLEALDWRLWYSVQPIEKIDWCIYLFIAKKVKPTRPAKHDPGEKIELMSVGFDELVDLSVTDDFRDKELTLKILTAKYTGKLDKVRELLSL